MADAVCNALPFSCARLAQTPARQSACSSPRICKLICLDPIHAALRLLYLGQQPQLVLHVVARLMGNH